MKLTRRNFIRAMGAMFVLPVITVDKASPVSTVVKDRVCRVTKGGADVDTAHGEPPAREYGVLSVYQADLLGIMAAPSSLTNVDWCKLSLSDAKRIASMLASTYPAEEFVILNSRACVVRPWRDW